VNDQVGNNVNDQVGNNGNVDTNRSRLTPPDLNPVERIWGNLKGGDLANLCLDTIDEAEEIVDQGLCRIGAEARLAFAFLHHCGLSL
jgi:hypothetical protein